jgi:hypothetical protein
MAGSAHLYSLILLVSYLMERSCLVAGIFGTYPSCYALLFYFLYLFLVLGLVWGLSTLPWRLLIFLNSWGWGWVSMDGLGRHMYPPTENVWQSLLYVIRV